MTDPTDLKLTRRAVLAGSAGALAWIGLAQSPRALARRSDPLDERWLLPAHDLAGTRSSAVTVGAPTERWRAHLAGGITGAPLIARDRVLAASFGGDVGAFDLATGGQLWVCSLGTATYGTGADSRELGFFGGVAASRNRIVVASDHAQCLDARTGSTIWQAAPLSPPGGDDYFWAPPVIVGPMVLLGSGSGSEDEATRGRLSAYSLANGEMLWTTPTVPAGGNGGGIVGQPTVDRERRRIYIATGATYVPESGSNPGTESLVELRLDNGAITFSDQVHPGDQLGLDLNSAPVLAGDLIVVAGKDGFRAWNRITKTRVWHTQITPATPAPGQPADPTSGPEGGPVAFDGRRIYGLSNDSAAGTCVAVALDPPSGSVLWETTLPAFSFAPPAVADDVVAVPGSDGTLRLLAPRNGALLSALPLLEPSSGAPSVTNGVVLAGTGAAPFLPGDSLVAFASAAPDDQREAQAGSRRRVSD
jgi:outer membrane protein assembly factor BamB